MGVWRYVTICLPCLSTIWTHQAHTAGPPPKSFPPSLCCSASSFSPEQRAEIIREVLEDLISPTDVAKKYNISPHSIRDWIKKTGQALPKSYKKPADYNRDKPAVPG